MADLARTLADLLERRHREQAPLRPARVAGRHEDGTELLEPLSGTCITRGTAQSHGRGQVVAMPLEPFSTQGASGLPLLRTEGALPLVWIERLEPNVLPAGTTLEVKVHGLGLTEDLPLDFLEPGAGPTISPWITIESRTLASPELLILTLTIDPAAPKRRPADLAYGA